MLFSSLTNDILQEVYTLCDDYTKVKIIIATFDSTWGCELHKFLKSRPVELHFGDLSKLFNSRFTIGSESYRDYPINASNFYKLRSNYYPTNWNFILMKNLDCKFNLNLHSSDIKGETLFRVMEFAKYSHVQHKINSIDISLAKIHLNSLDEFRFSYKDSFKLIKGVDMHGSGEILPKYFETLQNITRLTLEEVDCHSCQLFAFQFPNLRYLELSDCIVGFIPQNLISLKMEFCEFKILAVFPETLEELILEHNAGGATTAGVLELTQELEGVLKRLTYRCMLYYETFIEKVFQLNHLDYLEINVPQDYKIIFSTQIKQIVLTRMFNKGLLVKKIKLNRNKNNEWTLGSKIKAKIVCKTSGNLNKKFPQHFDKTLACIEHTRRQRRGLERSQESFERMRERNQNFENQ